MSVKIQISQKTRTKIEEICKSFNNEPGELINVLHKTQDYLGYLPAEAQEVIGQELKIPTAKVYGVVSFYSFFTMIPKGRFPVSICMGTACYVRGAERILDELKHQLELNVGETSADGLFSLASLRCVGACGLAPVVLVGDKVYGRLAPDDVKNMVDEYKDMRGAV
ncbi:MAG: NAD(P)H-dependent oxidoreductase subunit E [Bacteroidales bacterium]|jgi:NADH-quinone oxidoreductase subunit E/NADP-reducing hydrogenase subunit HndA|nr:NAD(P)H-dependent oxidoreductase subunit E [Bacteroidales bacterium]